MIKTKNENRIVMCRACRGAGFSHDVLDLGHNRRMHVRCYARWEGEDALLRLPLVELSKVRLGDVRASTVERILKLINA